MTFSAFVKYLTSLAAVVMIIAGLGVTTGTGFVSTAAAQQGGTVPGNALGASSDSDFWRARTSWRTGSRIDPGYPRRCPGSVRGGKLAGLPKRASFSFWRVGFVWCHYPAVRLFHPAGPDQG